MLKLINDSYSLFAPIAQNIIANTLHNFANTSNLITTESAMSDLKVTSNYKPRTWSYFSDLTRAQQKEAMDEFGFDQAIEENYAVYKNVVFTINDFMSFGNDPNLPEKFKNWDGYAGDSFFSGTLIKLLDNDEFYLGSYTS